MRDFLYELMRVSEDTSKQGLIYKTGSLRGLGNPIAKAESIRRTGVKYSSLSSFIRARTTGDLG